MLGDGQRGLGVRLGNDQDGPPHREQIVEPARHRNARDVPAIGNEPEIRGRKKRFEIFVRNAIDQGDIGKSGLRLHFLQPIEADTPAREQEMNTRIIPQQSRRLKHDDGIMGEPEIAGQADNEARRHANGDRDYLAPIGRTAGVSVAQFGIKRSLSRVTPR